MSILLRCKMTGVSKARMVEVNGSCTSLRAILKFLDHLSSYDFNDNYLDYVEENLSSISTISLDNNSLEIYSGSRCMKSEYVMYDIEDVVLDLEHILSITYFRKSEKKEKIWDIRCYDKILAGKPYYFGRYIHCYCSKKKLAFSKSRYRFLNRRRVLPRKNEFQIQDIKVPQLGSEFYGYDDYSSLEMTMVLRCKISNKLSTMVSDSDL